MTETPQLLDLRLTDVAHGGHMVARTEEGRVVFVRHGLPGELVRVALTDDEAGASFWRGDVVEVLEPAPGRITPDCPVSGPGGCGGCDFQHVEAATQRALKTAVVREQLERLAGYRWEGEVVAVGPPWPGEPESSRSVTSTSTMRPSTA